MMVQFCSNSVTGTIIAPALAWFGLGLGFVIHGWHHIHPGKCVNTG